MLAHVAQELEHAERLGPGAVVDQQRRRPLVEVEELGQLGPDGRQVASRVASSSRLRSSERPPGSPIMPVAPPASGDRPVAGVLEAPQQQQRHQVADVQAVGGRVEAGVEGDRALGQAAGAARPGRCCRAPARGPARSSRMASVTGSRSLRRSTPVNSDLRPAGSGAVAGGHTGGHGRLTARVRRPPDLTDLGVEDAPAEPVRPPATPGPVAVITTCVAHPGHVDRSSTCGVAVQPPVDKLASPAFAQQAEPICKATADQLAALPKAFQSPTNVARAEVVAQAQRRAAGHAGPAGHRSRPAATTGASCASGWATTASTWATARTTPAGCAPIPRLASTRTRRTPGEQISIPIDTLATANDMDDCVAPEDLS